MEIERLDSAGSKLSNMPKFVKFGSVNTELFEKSYSPLFLPIISERSQRGQITQMEANDYGRYPMPQDTNF